MKYSIKKEILELTIKADTSIHWKGLFHIGIGKQGPLLNEYWIKVSGPYRGIRLADGSKLREED